MGDILFLAHRIPFPPDRGDKIRSHHVLKALARLAPVHVGCLAESDEDREHEEELAAVATTHCLADRQTSLPVAGMKALLTGRAVSETSFASRTLQNWVDCTLAERDISAIYVFSGQMTQYLSDNFDGRLVIDFVDADSAKFAAYGNQRSLMAWVHRREAKLVRALETCFAARADHALLVTGEEAAAFKVGLPTSETYSLGVLANGMDAEAFDPDNLWPDPYRSRATPRLIFTGQMDYPPNVAAAKRLACGILPLVKQAHARASVEIVGRSPVGEVRTLANDSVRVHGGVSAMQDYLSHADIAVVPLEIARGVQNKVLEAMAMGLPCVVSEGAATGIAAKDGRDFLIARSDADFTEAIDRLAKDADFAAEMGRAARRWVVEKASWDAALAELPALVGMADG